MEHAIMKQHSVNEENEIKSLCKYIGYDDDENSLIHQLIHKKNDLNECYRILFHLTLKNRDDFVWNFIIRVFLDFYAELNPKMEQFIFKLKIEQKQNQNRDQNMLFAYIVKNMFIRNSISYNVYNARVGILTYKYTISIRSGVTTRAKANAKENALMKLVSNYGAKYSVLLNALHTKNIDKVAYKVFTHLKHGDDVDVLHRIIISYFSCIYFAEECEDNEEYNNEEYNNEEYDKKEFNEPNKKIFEKWLQIKENITSAFYFNYLISIIIHLFADEININKSVMFVKPNPDIILLLKN